MRNWAGNITYDARRIVRPTTVGQLRRLVAGSARVRALGTGHSFNRIADTPGDLVSLSELPPCLDVDTERATVRVSAATRYGELAARLQAAGHALPNLASLPHISVAGACTTATHGSGSRNGCLATAVRGLEMVTAGGELVTLNRDSDGFAGAFAGSIVALGALGVVTTLTLDLVPAFDLRQLVYVDVPRERFDAGLEDIFASAYSVSAFTDWTGPTINQVWFKCRDAEQPRLDAAPATQPRHPIAGMPPAHCTEQLGVPGPWHERLPHFRAEFTPSSGDELQSELFVPASRAVEALAAIDRVRDLVAPVLQICELRTVAADELWLSPGYRRDSLTIHFTWVNDAHRVRAAIRALEAELVPFDPRPHWAKLFLADPGRHYQRLPDFQRLLHDHDPAGKFSNPMLDRLLRRTGSRR